MSLSKDRTGFFNTRRLQDEVLRLEKVIAQQQQQYQQLMNEAKRVSDQGSIVDSQRQMLMAYLIATVLEHHQGQVGIYTGLVETLMQGAFQVQTKVSQDGTTVFLTAADENGRPVEKAGIEAGAAIAAKALPLEPEPERPARCAECSLAYGEHRENCPLKILAESKESLEAIEGNPAVVEALAAKGLEITHTCELCGKPMPKGEEMFKYHGYSGPCPDEGVPASKRLCAT